MLVIVGITAVLVEYIERISLIAVIESLNTMISTGSTETNTFANVRNEIETAKHIVFGTIVGASVLTGFIATRLALRPVHDALTVRKRFIASVAHELRTPLAVLKTQNEVAQLDVDPTSPVARTLEQNVEEIDQVTDILNSLLLFNRVDTLESIAFVEVDLSKIIATVVERLQTLAEKKGIMLQYKETVIPYVYGNATALEQAFFNIAKNALNHSERGGEVLIECLGITEHDITISITDTGCGIPRKDLPHIFEPFYRSEKNQNKVHGSGLGLALVFEIIKIHNGKIGVKSSEGTGTRFMLTLPRQQSAALMGFREDGSGLTYDFTTR